MAILLIEDDPAVQELVTTLLCNAGFSVDVAANGTNGYGLCLSEKYEVIILDLGLPDMNGLDLLRRIRNEGVTTHVLILTAKDDPEDKVLGLDTGADDYLSKTLRPARVGGPCAGAAAAEVQCEESDCLGGRPANQFGDAQRRA